jgi:hypothetical protein
MNRDEVNTHIILAIYGDSDPIRALNSGEGMSDDNEDPQSPVAKAFQHAALNHALGKAPLEDWNETIGDAAPAPKPARDFIKSSDERFARVSARIRELCGPHGMETAEEMIEAARKLRDETRAEFLANA